MLATLNYDTLVASGELYYILLFRLLFHGPLLVPCSVELTLRRHCGCGENKVQ